MSDRDIIMLAYSASLSKDADADSRLDIRVFCQSQTKKKGKRKKEVAAACGHSLGQLLKKQDFDKSKIVSYAQLPACYISFPLE